MIPTITEIREVLETRVYDGEKEHKHTSNPYWHNVKRIHRSTVYDVFNDKVIINSKHREG